MSSSCLQVGCGAFCMQRSGGRKLLVRLLQLEKALSTLSKQAFRPVTAALWRHKSTAMGVQKHSHWKDVMRQWRGEWWQVADSQCDAHVSKRAVFSGWNAFLWKQSIVRKPFVNIFHSNDRGLSTRRCSIRPRSLARSLLIWGQK